MSVAERIAGHLQRAWLRRGPTALLLLPVTALYASLVAARRLAYRLGWLRSTQLPLPVVVIGNRIAGGAGKTPTTLAVLGHLQSKGWTPGVLTRGHGARPPSPPPTLLDAITSPQLDANATGDEPQLIWRRSGVPLMIGPDRCASAASLMRAHPEIDILVCDDGLQHLALRRDIEVIVFDERGAGNGWLLPSGPLREPVDAEPVGHTLAAPIVLYNATQPSTALPGNLSSRTLGPLVSLAAWWTGRPDVGHAQPPTQVHAMAGIAHPQRFFQSLRERGHEVTPCPLPDHARFDELPWSADVSDLVVTEKDAVKLNPERVHRERPNTRIWVAVLDLHPDPGFWRAFDSALSALAARQAERRPL